jgi:hypothetical protein
VLAPWLAAHRSAGVPAWRIRRRAMSSPRATGNKPHPLRAMPAGTATAIPITASTAIGAGAPRPDGRSGRPAEDATAAEAWGPVREQLPSTSSAPVARPARIVAPASKLDILVKPVHVLVPASG